MFGAEWSRNEASVAHRTKPRLRLVLSLAEICTFMPENGLFRRFALTFALPNPNASFLADAHATAESAMNKTVGWVGSPEL
jgi:hypothetical protein